MDDLRTDTGPPVSGLFLGSSPATVARFVVPVYVDAVKSKSEWTLSDICEKVEERTPALANLDAASTIPLPIRGVGIGAALDHGFPSCISWTLGQAVLRSLKSLASVHPVVVQLTQAFSVTLAAALRIGAGSVQRLASNHALIIAGSSGA